MNLSLNKSILNTKPLKSIPRGLIYHAPKSDMYSLVDLNSKKCVGKKLAYPKSCTNSTFYNVEPNGKTFHIYSLKISEKNQGWGSYFIKFAKNESIRRNCKGRVSLVAFYPGKAPHIFYKKQGFVTKDKNLNSYLDKCIQEKYNPAYLNAVDMFIPIEKYTKTNKPKETKKASFLNKTYNFFKKIFA